MNKKITWLKQMADVGLAAAMLAISGAANAALNLVQNGDFSSYVTPTYPGFSPTYNGYSFQFGNAGNTSGAGYVNDWSIGGSSCGHNLCTGISFTVNPAPNGVFNFLFLPNTATSPGAVFAPGNLWELSGAASNYPGPFGGNLVAMDAGFTYTISQNISGLSPNTTYSLSFETAATQQFPLTGTLPCGSVSPGNSDCTTEYWQVSLGSQSDLTPVITAPGRGFNGWFQEDLTFTTPQSNAAPGSLTELLTFLAVGNPEGVPPMALLSNVCLVQGQAPSESCYTVPEPASLSLLGSGLVAVAALCRPKRLKVSRG